MKKKQAKHPPKKMCGTELSEPGSSPVCYAESGELLPAYRLEIPEKEPPPPQKRQK